MMMFKENLEYLERLDSQMSEHFNAFYCVKQFSTELERLHESTQSDKCVTQGLGLISTHSLRLGTIIHYWASPSQRANYNEDLYHSLRLQLDVCKEEREFKDSQQRANYQFILQLINIASLPVSKETLQLLLSNNIDSALINNDRFISLEEFLLHCCKPEIPFADCRERLKRNPIQLKYDSTRPCSLIRRIPVDSPSDVLQLLQVCLLLLLLLYSNYCVIRFFDYN